MILLLKLLVVFSVPVFGCDEQLVQSAQSQLSEPYKKEFKTLNSISNTTSMQNFSWALYMKGHAKTQFDEAFAEYWMSKSLMDAELYHLSFKTFFALLSKDEIQTDILIIQRMSLSCLTSIYNKFSALEVSENEYELLLKLPDSNEKAYALSLLGVKDFYKIERTLAALQNHPDELLLYKGFLSTKKQNSKDTASSFLSLMQSKGFQKYERLKNVIYLLTGRALYEQKAYTQAAQIYLKIEKSSNELTHSLVELGYSYLQAAKYQDALGTAVSMQAGNFKNAFVPQSLFLMAVIYNELCHFPDSLTAAHLFKKNYKNVYEELKEIVSTRPKAYPIIVSHLKKKPVLYSKQIINEWVRSPIFLSKQDELNLYFNEIRRFDQTKNIASKNINPLVRDIQTLISSIKPAYKKEKALLKYGDKLPGYLLSDIENLKEKVIQYIKWSNGLIVWDQMKNYSTKTQASAKSKLVNEINADVYLISKRMLRQMSLLVENINLVEVEIFQGASKDLVWKNAHPDYKDVFSQINDQVSKTSGAKVWNWGERSPAGIADQEIWEDELGSFRANLGNNCKNQEKYLSVKLSQMEEK